MTIREKYVQLRGDLMDSKANFASFHSANRSAVAATGEIVGYIEEKCGIELPAHEGRLTEMRRDCGIYNSRLAKLKDNLIGLEASFDLATPDFERKETPDTELNEVFDGLVTQYLAWYARYNEFKAALKSAKKKWYGYEEGILSAVA
jgi:hypothetical protein